MIGQVISQTLGLPAMNLGSFSKSAPVEEVASEENGQPHNQSFSTRSQEVVISDTAQKLNQELSSDQPNWQEVQALAAQLSSSMDSAFLKAGIDTSQPIRINIHPFTGIPFVGEHPDKNRIQALLDGTPELLQQIKNVNTVASYSYRVSMDQHGLSSASSLKAQMAVSDTQEPVSGRLKSALQLYEQTTQTTRLSMEYRQDVGITLDVLSSGTARR